MAEAVAIVGVDGGGVVVAHRTLRPNRIVRLPGAEWILETRLADEIPRIGAQLLVRRGLT